MGRMIAFHGTDHKAGCSMTALCAAEDALAAEPSARVLLLKACGPPFELSGASQGSKEDLGRLLSYIKSGRFDMGEIMERARTDGGLYVIRAPLDPGVTGYFDPASSAVFLRALKDSFDLMICDSGCELENAMALACLEESGVNVLVAEDREQSIKRHEWLAPYYKKLGIAFSLLVINRFRHRAGYASADIKTRLRFDNSNTITVKYSENESLSDCEGLSLLQYRDPGFAKDIRRLTAIIREEKEGASYGGI